MAVKTVCVFLMCVAIGAAVASVWVDFRCSSVAWRRLAGQLVLHPRIRRWKMSQEFKWKILSFLADHAHAKMASHKKKHIK